MTWVIVTDPRPDELARHAAGSVVWCECKRCGERAGIALPIDLGTAAVLMRAIGSLHRYCPQTLAGARWELLVALRRRRDMLSRRAQLVSRSASLKGREHGRARAGTTMQAE